MDISMADCDGQIVTSLQTDRDMRNYIERSAEERGVSKSEFLRRVLDAYRVVDEGEAKCPDCGSELRFDL